MIILFPLYLSLLAPGPVPPGPNTANVDDSDRLGPAVVAVGDVDGDGFGDFAFAHRGRSVAYQRALRGKRPEILREPRIWILSGKEGRVLRRFDGQGEFGALVESVGDLDGDGILDLAVGAGRDGSGTGQRVVVLSVGAGSQLADIGGSKRARSFGRDVAGGQQLVGDPTPDLLISAVGIAWVIDGKTFEPVDVLLPSKNCGLQRERTTDWNENLRAVHQRFRLADGYESEFGTRVGVLPDLDGDGIGEVSISGEVHRECKELLGNGDENSRPGCRTRVYFSGDKHAPLHLQTDAWRIQAGHDLDGDGVRDLVTTTVDEAARAWSVGKHELLWDQLYMSGYMTGEGTGLQFMADCDGDAIPDLVMTANRTSLFPDHGELFVLSGASGKVVRSQEVMVQDESKKEGRAPGGIDAVPIGDFNGDGIEEIATQLPILQEIRVLNGKDLTVLWSLSLEQFPRAK